MDTASIIIIESDLKEIISEVIKNIKSQKNSENLSSKPLLENSIKCEYCDKGFILQEMREHMKKGHSRCPICSSKVARVAGHMDTHIKICSGGKPTHTDLEPITIARILSPARFKCHDCNTDYSYIHSLNEHIVEKHSEFSQALQCPECKKEYYTENRLKEHIKYTHSLNQKDFRCFLCDKTFSNRITLDGHLHEIHSKTSSTDSCLKCLKCGEIYKYGIELTEHIMKRHCEDIEKEEFDTYHQPFKCSMCGKHFVSPAGINLHTRNEHSDQNCLNISADKELSDNKNTIDLFNCPQCNLAFINKDCLDRHIIRKHSQTKKPQLDKNVFQKNSNYSYNALVIGPFQCSSPGCPYTTSTTQQFGRHWNSRHLQQAPQASFLDTTTSTTVTIYDVFALVLQCLVCGAVRCDADKIFKGMRSRCKGGRRAGIKMHLTWQHPKEVETASSLSQLYKVLQNLKGRRIYV